MKTKLTPPTPNLIPTNQAEATKLMSLLALATGAVALPQAGHADIIYNPMSPVVVGYGGVDQFEFTLPGTARFGFQRGSYTTSSLTATLTATFPMTFRTVNAGDFATVTSAAFAGIRGAANGSRAVPAPAGSGATWDQGTATWNFVTVGWANNYGHQPTPGYDHQYLAWTFNNSSQGGAARYGWIDVSLSINNVSGPGTGPNVTIWGYAYDDSGAKPLMGQVPEPTSLSLLVLGAMALGSRGLRQWRRHRDAVAKA